MPVNTGICAKRMSNKSLTCEASALPAELHPHECRATPTRLNLVIEVDFLQYAPDGARVPD